MEDDEVEVVPMPQYPLPEQIHPEIHEAISNAQIWVVPGPSGGRSSFVQRNQNAPVFREVFLCRRNNASQAYQIIHPPAFQPVTLQHGGPIWGYLFMGIIIPRRKDDLIYVEPSEQSAQRVAIKRLDLRVVNMELQNGSRENPFKEVYRMQTIGDNVHVVGIIEALQDENYLYIITPWCEGGSLSDNIPLIPNEQYTIEDQARILFQQILENLHYVNRVQGICHRDVKPANFLVSRHGRVLITDLAMSFKMPEGNFIKDIGQFGTPPFMVPEIALSQPFDGTKCDFWASMITLYSLITGLPFLYRSPRPDDILFRYCIMARGLSRDKHNKLVDEIVNEVDGKEDIHMLAVASQQINKMGVDLLELFENSLSLIPEQRWGMEEAAQSRWMKGGEII
jgi:serine/threonine protein kinase